MMFGIQKGQENIKAKAILKKSIGFVNKNNTFFVFLLLVIISCALTSNFFCINNVTNLLRQNAPLGLVSLGMLLVIITGGIDLSIGAVVALANVVFAFFLDTGYGLVPAVAFTLLIGLALGIVGGFLVAYQKLAPFVVTLAIMSIARGFAYIVSKGSSIRITNEAFLSFGRSYILGIPTQFYLMILFFVIIFLIFKYMKYGRLVVAIGSNEEAVRLSGIRVNRYKMSVYCISCVFSALAGLLVCGRTGVGSPLVGVGMEMDAIAAVVIGGASLSGGKGSVVKTLFGVYTLGIIGNIMNLMTIPAYPQQVIKGAIILAAVLLQKFSAEKKQN